MERTYDEPEEADYSDSDSGERRELFCDQGRDVQGSCSFFWTQDEGGKNAVRT